MANTVKKLYFGVPKMDAPVGAAATHVASGGGASHSTTTRYYLRYAWVTASGETLPSVAISSSLLPSSSTQNYVITVPAFPAGVTSVNIYACSFNYNFSSALDDLENAQFYLQGNSVTTTFNFSSFASATKAPTVDTSGLENTVAYTTPGSTKTIVKGITICNTTDFIAMISIAVRVTGSSTTLSRSIRIVSDRKISPRETVFIPLSLVLEATETILAQQHTENALTLHISGVEVV